MFVGWCPIVHKEANIVSYAYETMYILRPDLGEELLDQTINQYQALLKDQGADEVHTQHRGRRRLAYDIKKYREGIYVQMNYSGVGSHVAVLERAMRLSDDVIRYLTIRQDETEAAEPAEAAVLS